MSEQLPTLYMVRDRETGYEFPVTVIRDHHQDLKEDGRDSQGAPKAARHGESDADMNKRKAKEANAREADKKEGAK